MEILFWVYVVVAVFWLIVSICYGLDAREARNDEEAKTCARMIFLTPVWPLVILFLIGLGIRELWRTADWQDFF